MHLHRALATTLAAAALLAGTATAASAYPSTPAPTTVKAAATTNHQALVRASFVCQHVMRVPAERRKCTGKVLKKVGYTVPSHWLKESPYDRASRLDTSYRSVALLDATAVDENGNGRLESRELAHALYGDR